MSTTHTTGQAGLAPRFAPQTLGDNAREAQSMGDEDIESAILSMQAATHLGKYAWERVEVLKSEQSRRWRLRRGEGRVA